MALQRRASVDTGTKRALFLLKYCEYELEGTRTRYGTYVPVRYRTEQNPFGTGAL